MDQKLKADWIAALRSGEYTQTHETLHDGAGYCCLGVLCEIAGLKIWEDGGGVGIKGDRDAESCSAYEPIFDLVGGHDKSHQLSKRNDGISGYHKHTFSEIADYIEKEM